MFYFLLVVFWQNVKQELVGHRKRNKNRIKKDELRIVWHVEIRLTRFTSSLTSKAIFLCLLCLIYLDRYCHVSEAFLPTVVFLLLPGPCAVIKQASD